MGSAARATKPPKPAAPPAIPPMPVRRFGVAEYHRMGELGLLTKDDRVELIHGWIVPKMTLNPPHTYAVTLLMKRLLALVGPTGVVRVQQPITMSDSEPEPDVVLAAGRDADYKSRHPRPSDCHLVVEVADSSRVEDQTTKLELYAGAKVAVYWIVNLKDRRVEVDTQPRGGKNPRYQQQTDYGPGDEVPAVVGGKGLGRIPVKELLP